MPGLEMEHQPAGHRQDTPHLISLLNFQIQNPGSKVNLLIYDLCAYVNVHHYLNISFNRFVRCMVFFNTLLIIIF